MKNKNRIIICCLLITSALIGIFYFWWQNRKPVLVENIVGSVQVVSSGKTKEIREMPFEISIGDKILTGSGSIAGIDFGQNQIKTIGEKREVALVDIKDTGHGGKHYKFLENGQTWEHVTTQTSSVTAAIVGWNGNNSSENENTISNSLNPSGLNQILNTQEVLGINEDYTKTEADNQENRIFSKEEIDALKKCIIQKQNLYKDQVKNQDNKNDFKIDQVFRECLQTK